MTPFLGASAPWRQHVATGKQASKTCQGGHRGEGEKRKEILFTRRKAIHLVQFFPAVSISGVLYLKSRDPPRDQRQQRPLQHCWPWGSGSTGSEPSMYIHIQTLTPSSQHIQQLPKCFSTWQQVHSSTPKMTTLVLLPLIASTSSSPCTLSHCPPVAVFSSSPATCAALGTPTQQNHLQSLKTHFFQTSFSGQLGPYLILVMTLPEIIIKFGH